MVADGTAMSDRGSAVVIVLVSASTVAVAAAVAIGSLIVDLVDAARARTAADAAALASVHGATLVEWHHEGADVVVRVRVGDAMATARATNAP